MSSRYIVFLHRSVIAMYFRAFLGSFPISITDCSVLSLGVLEPSTDVNIQVTWPDLVSGAFPGSRGNSLNTSRMIPTDKCRRNYLLSQTRVMASHY